ncbi:cell division protein FtsZ [Phaeovulum vinaykumarii]|uniref:Cell division protein FtsZ n=1 Tax=Phaeovulum vinaykumarii TaxID=407234 RepID=A0A1N7MGN1_9RHOB|nr:cell division protein FtsZ [Phaeovulum vinaykumarii]SIS85109.1 cell division protein FtsZ [Phaeovulum vinaykumarii]SOC12087.1 cell division protein FtsZ [Phaeovulum vinaykumarii]
MALNLTMAEHEELKPRITVFGVGGAGGNAVNNMIEKQLSGVDFVVANTDAQALQQSRSSARIQIGVKVTEGLGAGARATVGAAAAEESIEQIVDHLAGVHMCFITAGMGGGTGTGAAPIIAQAARELGVLTVGVVTKPFQFEGTKRMRQAEAGIEALQKVVDTLIVIPNQNLFRLANEKTTFTEAFAMADDVLYQGVKGVTDLMVRPGLINLDFADVRAVMDEMGKAMMGTGEAQGDDRAVQAAEKAIANPLLDEISLRGARGVLINITGGYDLTLFELDEAANRIREEVDPEANIIVGSTLDPEMEGQMRVSVVATGIDAAPQSAEAPSPRRAAAEAVSQRPAPAPSPERAAPAAERAAPAAQPAEARPAVSISGVTATPAQPAPRASEPARSLFEDDLAAEDDALPPPAYRAAAPTQMQGFAEPQEDMSGFVAPRRAAPGTPSPEALARLNAAAGRVPGAAPRQPAQPMAATRAAAPALPAAHGAARGGEKPRFGINSLINRMTGNAEAAPERPERAAAPAAPAARRAPPQASQYDDEDEGDFDQDRIEIPAFLRRQAN